MFKENKKSKKPEAKVVKVEKVETNPVVERDNAVDKNSPAYQN